MSVLSTEFEFLGFAFVKSCATINVSPKALRKFRRRVVEITGRSRGISMQRRLDELRRYHRGWMDYFRLGFPVEVVSPVGRLDPSTDSMLLLETQWRRPKSSIVETSFNVGVPRRQANRHARISKGPWHMSKMIASGVGMPNQWLEQHCMYQLANSVRRTLLSFVGPR